MKKTRVDCLNLKERIDRKSHIETEFLNFPEFELHVFEAIKRDKGAYGIWLSLQSITKNHRDKNSPYFILCQDDHVFTENFDFNSFREFVSFVENMDADLLFCGVSSFENAVQISENIFWLDSFTGLQFVVIFNRMFNLIIDSPYNTRDDAADKKLSSLSKNKFCIYPFYSIQKEFGYSDVTPRNGVPGVVDHLFKEYEKALGILDKVRKFYSK